MKNLFKKTLLAISQFLLRYGLGIVLIWLGLMKFRNAEALHIEQAMAQTFLFKWLLKYVTIYAFAQIIAWIQILSGLLIMLNPVSKKSAAWGGALAVLIFVAGILIFITSGIVWQTGYGFPELSRTGHALIKDFILLGAATWCWSDSL
jgi:uncharacterized membrane protein YkgB